MNTKHVVSMVLSALVMAGAIACGGAGEATPGEGQGAASEVAAPGALKVEAARVAEPGATVTTESAGEGKTRTPELRTCPSGEFLCHGACIDPNYQVCCPVTMENCGDHCQAKGTACW